MLPTVIPEKLVRRFFFYLDREIRQGMVCRNGLYKLVETFPMNSRPQAYAMAIKLSGQGEEVVITASATQYEVWLGLRSARQEAQSNFSLDMGDLALSL